MDLTQCQIALGMKDDAWNKYRKVVLTTVAALMPRLIKIYKKEQDSIKRIEARNKKAVVALMEWHRAKKIEKNAGKVILSDTDMRTELRVPSKHETTFLPPKHVKPVKSTGFLTDK